MVGILDYEMNHTLLVQAEIQDLKNKLIAGKNEQVQGYQKFANAQFYGNYQALLI